MVQIPQMSASQEISPTVPKTILATPFEFIAQNEGGQRCWFWRCGDCGYESVPSDSGSESASDESAIGLASGGAALHVRNKHPGRVMIPEDHARSSP